MASSPSDNPWSSAMKWSDSDISSSSTFVTWPDDLDQLLFQFPDGLQNSVVGGSVSTDSQDASQSHDCQPFLPPTEEANKDSDSVKSCTLLEPSNSYDKQMKIEKKAMKRERRFVCTAKGCGKSFAKKWNLQAHERLHSGEKPFVCRIGCGERYMWMSSLKSHERRKCSLLPEPLRFQRKSRSLNRPARAEVPLLLAGYGVQAPSNEDKLMFELELEHIIAEY